MKASTFVLASLVTSTAYAERVGVVVTGEATVQPQLAAQLESWLENHGREVVPGPMEPEAISTLIDCFVLEDLKCARGVVDARSKSKAIVFARAETTQNDDGTRNIAITGYWFQKQKASIAERRVCERCNDQMLHATVDELMLALVHEPPLPAPDAPKPGPIDQPQQDTARTRWQPLALLAAGGVALVAGGVMIAIDQDVDPTGPQSPNIRDTATGGVIIGLAGAAALGAGVFLWMRDKQSAPVASVSGNGAFVGWAGRF